MKPATRFDLLGRGIGLPLHPDEHGRLPRASGPEKYVRRSSSSSTPRPASG